MYNAWVQLMFANRGINILTTNLSEISEKGECYVFPNPASEKIHFKVPEPSVEVSIFNIAGTKIYQEIIENKKSFKIGVSDWEKGIYYYRVKTFKNKIYTGSFVLK